MSLAAPKHGEKNALESKDAAPCLRPLREPAALSSCAGTLRGRVRAGLAAKRPLPSFYPRGNLNNRHSSHSRRKMVCIARQGDFREIRRSSGSKGNSMSIAQGQAQGRARAAPTPRAISGLLSTLAADDPVASAIRASARRMIGVAVFSGVINILMLSGSAAAQ